MGRQHKTQNEHNCPSPPKPFQEKWRPLLETSQHPYPSLPKKKDATWNLFPCMSPDCIEPTLGDPSGRHAACAWPQLPEALLLLEEELEAEPELLEELEELAACSCATRCLTAASAALFRTCCCLSVAAAWSFVLLRPERAKESRKRCVAMPANWPDSLSRLWSSFSGSSFL